MKTLFTLFVSLFVLSVGTSFSQDQKSVFERAALTKAGDGSPCIELSWKKGSENTAYFLVERSANGQDFKQVALVFTSEEVLFTDYKFRDKAFHAAGNTPYYRIVLVSDQKELTYLPAGRAEP